MDSTEKIMRAKVQLILNQPFFATLSMHLQYVPDTTQKTARTNGKCVKYNPSYVDQLSVDELKGVIAHEIMHTAMLHHTRRNHRDINRWNQACDYAINPLLIASNFVLPEGYLVNIMYDNMSAEQIYNLLPPPAPPDGQKPDNNTDNTNSEQGKTSNDPGGTGDVEDAPADANLQEAETEIKQTLAQAKLVAKRQGKLPAHLERLVNEILQPKVNWKETLARFLTEISKNDYTWKKPAMRYLHAGIYLPALESQVVGSIILIVDTSKSINEGILNQVAGEAHDIASTFNTSLQILYVDAQVQAIQTIEPDEPVKLMPKGGGGTDFRPGFTYIDKNGLEPRAVVYLTDGECSLFPTSPDFPVLWAKFGHSPIIPPFGETIQVV